MVTFAGVWDLGLEGTNYIDRFFMALTALACCAPIKLFGQGLQFSVHLVKLFGAVIEPVLK